MNVLISVYTTDLREIPYTDKKGQAQRLLVQHAYLHTLGADGKQTHVPPDKFEVILPKGQTIAYPEGDYTLQPSALYVDRNGRLACSPRLAPVKQARAA